MCLEGRKKDHQWVKDSYLATGIQDLDFAVTNKINGVRWGQNVIICFCGQNVPIGDEQKMPGQMNTVWGSLLTAAASVEITLYKEGTG